MYPKTIKQLFSLFLALVLCFGSLTVGVSAAGNGPAVSSNIDDHFYINAQRWTDPINSTLSAKGDGFERVEHINGTLVVEQYDANLKYISGKTLELELPIYGGVYMCDDYNFVVVGQNNYDEDDTVEVFRIIRYSKDWVRQASCGLYGANTIEPFQAGCVRFDRCGDYLYIRTAHKMYASANDGLNHQANVMINVRVSDMAIADSFTGVLNKNYGYISHSFNQFVRVDGTDLLAVDHGDALPRSVVLIKYNNPAGQDKFYGRVSYVNALPIIDSTYHYNDTGVSLGGFEFSSTDYLIAGCSYDQTVATDLMYAHRNIFVTATPKDNFTDAGTTVHWLTDYTANDNVVVSPPHMVKIEQDRFFLVWTENDVLKYCFINGRGELQGQIVTGKGDLSDCVPILADGRIIWYVTNNSAPVFYEISTGTPHSHNYTSSVTAPTCTEAGYTTYTCGCGDRYVADEVPALGHSWDQGTVTREPTEEEEGVKTYTCLVCGAVKEETIPELGHTHSHTAVVTKPTCTTDGYTTYTCKCGDSYIADVIPAFGHSWNSGVVAKEPTEEETGVKTYTCTACGETKDEVIPKLPHTHSHTAVVTAPTCTEAGYTTYTCRCGDSYVADYTDALGHAYDNGTCAVCGDVLIAAPVAKTSNKASNGKPVVTWEPVDGAVKYAVYRATKKDGTYSRKITTTNTTYTNTAATAGKYYYYFVRAYDADGNYADSNIVGRTCDLAQTTVKLSNVASTGKIRISWEPVEGATKYQVWRATSKNGTYTRLITTTATSVVNNKTEAGKTYYYKVRAVCDVSAATAAYSALKYRTCDLPQPDVSITRSSGKPKVSWEKVDGAVSYKVYRATSQTGTYSLVRTSTGSYYKDTKAVSGKTYYYKVVAVCSNTAGNSAYSAIVSIKATK